MLDSDAKYCIRQHYNTLAAHRYTRGLTVLQSTLLHSVSRPAVAAGFMSSGLNTLQRMLSHLLHSEEREWEALCPGLNVEAAREHCGTFPPTSLQMHNNFHIETRTGIRIWRWSAFLCFRYLITKTGPY